MTSARTIEGRWWIHGEDKAAHYGKLTFDPETGLKLVIKVPQSRTPVETLLSALRPAEGIELAIPKVLHGADAGNNPVTLFGCVGGPPSMSQGLDNYEIRALAALLNCHASTWNETKCRSVAVSYSLFHQWMNQKAYEFSQLEGNRTTIAFNPRPSRLIAVSPGVQLRIESIVENSSSSRDAMHMDFRHRVWFHFAQPTSIDSLFDEYVGVFLRLLCLLTGERIFAEKILLFPDDPFEPRREKRNQDFELLQKSPDSGKRTHSIHSLDLLTRFDEIEPKFDLVVKRWFELQKKIEPVLDLLLIVRSGRPSTVESQFLFLAQALEVFHGRSKQFTHIEVPESEHETRIREIEELVPGKHKPWLREKLAFSNQKTLATRIAETMTLCSAEAAALTTGIDDFAAKVRHTRNYYTHYTEQLREKGKIATGTELCRITLALKALLEICLLKELDIQGEPIARIISQFSNYEFVDLTSPRLP